MKLILEKSIKVLINVILSELLLFVPNLFMHMLDMSTMYVKYSIYSSKAVIEADHPMNVLYLDLQIAWKKCLSSHICYFVKIIAGPYSVMHMLNMSTLCRYICKALN